MSVSMHFQILRDPEHELFKKHMAVNQACLDAGIKKLPEETAAYFNCEYPECASEMERRALEIEKRDLNSMGAVGEWHDEYHYGHEIDITKLPPDAKIIRLWMG